MTVRVRKAVEGDIEWLLIELEEFARFADTKYSLLPREDSVRRQILKAFIEKHVFFVAEEEENGERLGFISGLVHPHVFNPQLYVCQEMWWWVPKKTRGRSRAGMMLLDAFTEWGRENVDWIFFSLNHNTPVRPEALEKRGYNFQEMQFLAEV